ncbi:MAG: hypothetical protein Q7K26_03475 [bacterium]|nr:hypothetical protein [bacterium]
MWNNLKNWHKSIIILVISFVVLYILGRLFVPIQTVDHPENYKWPPLIYSIFLVLPILIIKYSQRKFLKIITSIILGIFLLIIIVPLVSNWSEFYGNALQSSGNPLTAIFSVLYVMPLMGGLIALMLLFGGSM